MNQIYLDNAATSQTPSVVLDAMQAYYTDYRANIHRGFYAAAVQADKAYDASKSSVAELIGSKVDEIIYTSGATDSLNKLARMLESEITSKENIVLTEMEHHANLIPWQQLAKRTGCELRFIPVTDEYTLDYDAAETLIDTHTKIVSFVHVSNSLGTINDAAKICRLANKVDAYSIVDACQSIAHLPLDVQQLDCDFLVASGHKMYGPTGIGILYGKQTHLERLDPVVFGGDMIQSVTLENAVWADSPSKFEAGTPPIAEAIGLGAACKYIKDHRDTIHQEKEMTQYLLVQLEDVGATIIGPRENRVGVVSFTIGDAHPHDVADILATNNICVRAGHHCTMPLMKQLGLPGTVRASISMHTTRTDIDALIDGIKKVKTVFKI